MRENDRRKFIFCSVYNIPSYDVVSSRHTSLKSYFSINVKARAGERQNGVRACASFLFQSSRINRRNVCCFTQVWCFSPRRLHHHRFCSSMPSFQSINRSSLASHNVPQRVWYISPHADSILKLYNLSYNLTNMYPNIDVYSSKGLLVSLYTCMLFFFMRIVRCSQRDTLLWLCFSFFVRIKFTSFIIFSSLCFSFICCFSSHLLSGSGGFSLLYTLHFPTS